MALQEEEGDEVGRFVGDLLDVVGPDHQRQRDHVLLGELLVLYLGVLHLLALGVPTQVVHKAGPQLGLVGGQVGEELLRH